MLDLTILVVFFFSADGKLTPTPGNPTTGKEKNIIATTDQLDTDFSQAKQPDSSLLKASNLKKEFQYQFDLKVRRSFGVMSRHATDSIQVNKTEPNGQNTVQAECESYMEEKAPKLECSSDKSKIQSRHGHKSENKKRHKSGSQADRLKEEKGTLQTNQNNRVCQGTESESWLNINFGTKSKNKSNDCIEKSPKFSSPDPGYAINNAKELINMACNTPDKVTKKNKLHKMPTSTENKNDEKHKSEVKSEKATGHKHKKHSRGRSKDKKESSKERNHSSKCTKPSKHTKPRFVLCFKLIVGRVSRFVCFIMVLQKWCLLFFVTFMLKLVCVNLFFCLM